MLNPLYLTASRHSLYYFRFPIPAQFHPESKRSSLRLSLGTRCPKEALHLTRGLCYVGECVLSHMKAIHMDYDAIRSFLMQFFKKRLQTMKEKMAAEGQLPQDYVQAYQNSLHFCKEALEIKYYGLEGTDEDLNALIEKYSLPLKGKTAAFIRPNAKHYSA